MFKTIYEHLGKEIFRKAFVAAKTMLTKEEIGDLESLV